MANYSMNDMKNGLKVLIDGAPHVILDCDFVKPGKGQAFTRIRVRNLLTQRTVERTYKASDSVEGADVMEKDMQYLYNDGNEWHFMEPNTYEQMAIGKDAMADAALWIKEQDTCTITLWNDSPILVMPPNFVVLAITETDPGVKGDTAAGGSKPATLETGAVVRVPLFVQQGESIKVDTRTKAYVSRQKTD